jgi:hypothetical protein
MGEEPSFRRHEERAAPNPVGESLHTDVAGPIGLRLSARAEAGGFFVHAPLNTGVALLLPFTGSAKAALFGAA